MLVLGIGNRFRSDDGVGPLVARRLAARGVACQELSGEGALLMDAWRAAGHAVLVDAALSGAAPGTIHRFDAMTTTVPAGLFHYSSHQFSVAEAIEMARILGRLPAQMTVYGIEGRNFAYGEILSPEVAAAADAVEAEILGLATTRQN
jgi:hydrogenase maturation protease